MDIIHLISINSVDETFVVKLKELGIDPKIIRLPGQGGQLITIEIKESHNNWKKVIELVNEKTTFIPYGEGDSYNTFFSEDEIRQSEWSRLIPTFEQGYPQPQSWWPIKQLTLDDVCEKCGIYRQVNSMRFAKEPALGKKSFMTLIGISEIFCVPEVFVELNQIQAKGYQEKEVVVHKTNLPITKVRQLAVLNEALPGFIPEETLFRKTCSSCCRIKYYPHKKGIMRIKKNAISSDADFILTNEWFGSGLVAFREVLVSNRVVQLILEKEWLGCRLKPIELI
jgi:hypothetical protein